MSCMEWKEILVARVCGEIDDEESDRLSRHLSVCEECARAIGDLATTREVLRASAPDVPAAPRVVLLKPAPSRLAFLGIAAGLAAVGVLSGIGLAWSWQAREELARIVSTGEVRPAPVVEAVSREEMETWLDTRLARFQAESDLTSPPARRQGPGARPLSKPEVEALLTRMERRIDRDRVADLDYLLKEVAAAEARTGLQLGETRNALRVLALASDPRISEQ